MNGKQKGFTLIEILVVVTIIGVLAGLVVVLIPKSQEAANKAQCTKNVQGIVGLLIIAPDAAYNNSGPNLALYFVKKQDLVGPDRLRTLFCPGDPADSFEKAGGEDAYKNLDLKNHEFDNLTSYAGRDQANANCRIGKGSMEPAIMLCDDKEENHNKKGFICGFNDGSVKWRDKVDDWGKDMTAVVTIGEGSDIKELQCMRSE